MNPMWPYMTDEVYLICWVTHSAGLLSKWNTERHYINNSYSKWESPFLSFLTASMRCWEESSQILSVLSSLTVAQIGKRGWAAKPQTSPSICPCSHRKKKRVKAKKVYGSVFQYHIFLKVCLLFLFFLAKYPAIGLPLFLFSPFPTCTLKNLFFKNHNCIEQLVLCSDMVLIYAKRKQKG